MKNRGVVPILSFFIWIGWLSLLSQEKGYYIEEKVTMPSVFGMGGGAGITKIWLTDTYLRRDDGTQNQTTIVNSDEGKVFILDHSDTTYMDMTSEVFQGLAVMGLMMFGVTYDSVTGDPIIPNPLFQKSGRSQKIGDWLCHELTPANRHSSEGSMVQQMSIWISKETTLDGSLYANLIGKMMGDLGQAYSPFFDQLANLGGYPVFIQTNIMGAEMKQHLIHYENKEFPASIFQLPHGYKKKELNIFE